MDTNKELKLAELAEASGVPARTIRLYIAKKLVPPPRRAGRDAAYGPEHLDALRRIREGQRQGLTLEQIRRQTSGALPAAALPPPEAWWTYEVAPDVRVQVRGETSGRRLKQIRDAISTLHALVRREGDGTEEDRPCR